MEAANESARHAVNAVLQHQKINDPIASAGTPCDIWPIEDRELDDLQALRDLDQLLFDAGDDRGGKLPHFMDILELESLPATALASLWRAEGSPQGNPFDGLLEQTRAIATKATWPTDIIRLLRGALGRASTNHT
jgi:hypothetical protein